MKLATLPLILIFLLSAICLNAQEIKIKDYSADILVLRTYEAIGMKDKSSWIQISDGSENTETIVLENVKAGLENNNLKKLAQALNQIKDQGYTIVTSNSSGGSEEGLFITNYIFRKE